MRLNSLTADQLSGAQVLLAALLAVVGFFLLLPRPRGRFVPGGMLALIASASGFAVWGYSTFGKPMPGIIGTILFCLFSLGALGFGTVLVAQRNPARGAIAFSFVILSTCGLFLLLAAPFLMAATIIIYAGAIIVTFLFVLMLSQAQGPSDENDRSREPFFGALAGFAFTGLALFTVYKTPSGSHREETGSDEAARPELVQRLPAPVVRFDEQTRLLDFAHKLTLVADELATLIERINAQNGELASLQATDQLRRQALRDAQDAQLEEWRTAYDSAARELSPAVESIRGRLTIQRGGEKIELRNDDQGKAAHDRAEDILYRIGAIRGQVESDFINLRLIPASRVDEIHRLRERVLLLAGSGELPARNVANIGYLLYADHLLAVELAGTLLLVATIGAVAIARRRGVSG